MQCKMLSDRVLLTCLMTSSRDFRFFFMNYQLKSKDKHEIDSMQVMKINLAISENKTKFKKQSKLSKERHKSHFPQIGEVEKTW